MRSAVPGRLKMLELLRLAASCIALMLLAGCGGSAGSAPGAASSGYSGTGSGGGGSGGNSGDSGGSSTFTVGGTITGLGAATGLVLVNGSDTLIVPAGATSFTMPTSVGNGMAYSVTVKAHPTVQDCTVVSGAGTVSGANVTTVTVTCKAGTESVLHSFAGGPADGDTPAGSLIQASDGNLYGVTSQGGANSHGVVFKITPGGSESVLYSFAGGTADGAWPQGPLIQASDGNFYGVTYSGGASGNGVVYKITPGGTESVVYSFAGGATDGANPTGSLLQASDGNFYGVTFTGGSNAPIGRAGDSGVAYRLTPGGTETVLYSFIANASAFSANSGLIQDSDGNLYGLTDYGFFRITTDGSFTPLYSFSPGSPDGFLPVGSPLQASDGNFYGATAGGGAVNSSGVIFKITPGGAETALHSFAGGSTDGDEPQSGPIQASDGNLYGVTPYGGASNNGIVYQLTLSGTETVLYSFAGGTTDGAGGEDGLVQASDGTLYGVTYSGGASGKGTVFEIN